MELGPSVEGLGDVVSSDGKEDPERAKNGKVHTYRILDHADRCGGGDTRAVKNTSIWRGVVGAIDHDLDLSVDRYKLDVRADLCRFVSFF